MSMRTWVRKMAHEKAEMHKIPNVNNRQYFQGKVLPSKFAANWRKFAKMPIPAERILEVRRAAKARKERRARARA